MRRTEPLPEEDRLLAPGEAAAELGVEARALRNLEKAGKITALRTAGRHRRYRATDIARLKRTWTRARARKAKTA